MDQKHPSHPAIIKLLKGGHGHLASVIAMLEIGRPCLDIAQQIHAVEVAVGDAKRELIQDHMEHCLGDGRAPGRTRHWQTSRPCQGIYERPRYRNNRTRNWAVKWSFVILAVTAVLQVFVVVFSGSVALLADTIHDFGDAVTAVLLWIAFAGRYRAKSARGAVRR